MRQCVPNFGWAAGLCLALVGLVGVNHASADAPQGRTRMASAAESAELFSVRTIGDRLNLLLTDDSTARLVVTKSEISASDNTTGTIASLIAGVTSFRCAAATPVQTSKSSNPMKAT